MALPKSKQDLADWILRRLGAPLVNIEITDDQLEDVIDEALEFYYIWHYDGTQRSYRSIRVTSDMITGNNRKHQNINAPMYDITVDENYRVGDRVMTYVSGGNADSVWIKYDSEQQLYQYNFIEDPNGSFYHPGGANLDTEFFITTDATKYLDSDFTVVDPVLGTYSPNPNVLSDSDGGFVSYDSDLHNVFVYSVDSDTGLWVDSDSSFVVYDSDAHNTLQRFSRNSQVNGARYDRIVVKEFEKQYTWSDLWKEEQKVLTEPVLDIDYSAQGQIGIPVPDDIYGISKVFRVNSMASMGMWSYEYQMFMNNFDWFYGSGGAAAGALTNYYTTKLNIEFMDFMLNTQPAIRFNKHKNRLYIDTNWSRMERQKEYYLLAEVYEITNPDVWGDVYHDKWLMRYATSIAKMQWGSNLKKYNNVSLPGGLSVDGQAIYEEGKEEREKLEEEVKDMTSAMIDSIIIG